MTRDQRKPKTMKGHDRKINELLLYTDDVTRFCARQYAGCFSVEQVRRHLHQPLPLSQPLGQVGNIPSARNHYLSTCHCAPLHDRCHILNLLRTISRDFDVTIDVTFDQLRMSSESTNVIREE